MKIDLTTPAFKTTAHAQYTKWRNESPVLAIEQPGVGPAWVITRYDAVESWLKDDRLAKDPVRVGRKGGLAIRIAKLTPLSAFDRNMLDLDPPDHTRLRKLVHRAFTPRRIAELQDRVEHLADDLLAKAGSEFDLVRAFALPLPMTVICELLGIPESDHARIHRWSEVMVSTNPNIGALMVIPTLVRFARYLRGLVEQKRRNPDDRLISALVQAEDEGESLSADEVLGMIVLLVIAGHETTVNLIASGTLALLEHPDQLERLRADPALVPAAVEELLRFYPPVEIATERFAVSAMEIDGVPIPRGGQVHLVIGSANRDPRRFPAPDTLDIGRTDNRHLSFGYGRHLCIGAPLARLEAAIALRRLIALPNLRRTETGSPQWKGSLNLRGLRELRVAVG